MSDLISRLSLKDRASEYALSADEYERFCKVIDVEPTAYDLDNVVEELEKLADASNDHMYESYFDGKEDGIREAIEIVKQGCDETDDVCEWKKRIKTYDWEPSCEPNSTYNVAGVGWFRFCPYCGKKIKVVYNDNKSQRTENMRQILCL